MITKNSRYRDALLRTVPTSPTSTVTAIRRFPTASAYTGSYLVWKQGMRWDLLGARLYGDPGQWWRIMDLNPQIQSPTDVRPGMMLMVPGS